MVAAQVFACDESVTHVMYSTSVGDRMPIATYFGEKEGDSVRVTVRVLIENADEHLQTSEIMNSLYSSARPGTFMDVADSIVMKGLIDETDIMTKETILEVCNNRHDVEQGEFGTVFQPLAMKKTYIVRHEDSPPTSTVVINSVIPLILPDPILYMANDILSTHKDVLKDSEGFNMVLELMLIFIPKHIVHLTKKK